MIRIKTKEELTILREGGKILARVLKEVSQMVKPGVSTAKLEKRVTDMITKVGGRPTFKDYKMPTGEIFPTALCIAINDEVVHGPAEPGRVIKNGDIVGLDMGMEYPTSAKTSVGKPFRPLNKYSKQGGYYSDIATTVAAGEVGEDVKKLLRTTKQCLMDGIKAVQPGNTLNDIGRAIQTRAERAGYAVVRELVGHGVGHEAHEEPQVPNYVIQDTSLINEELKSGMVIAIEPMINMGGWKVMTKDDGYTIVTADGSLSAHFEHTVAVTKDGHWILTTL